MTCRRLIYSSVFFPAPEAILMFYCCWQECFLFLLQVVPGWLRQLQGGMAWLGAQHWLHSTIPVPLGVQAGGLTALVQQDRVISARQGASPAQLLMNPLRTFGHNEELFSFCLSTCWTAKIHALAIWHLDPDCSVLISVPVHDFYPCLISHNMCERHWEFWEVMAGCWKIWWWKLPELWSSWSQWWWLC